MAKEITLQDLIEKVKRDLFSSYEGKDKEGKMAHPIFFVNNVELEVTVTFSYDTKTGLKGAIPRLGAGSIGAGHDKSAQHKMKISLSPILTQDEMRKMAKKDEELWEGIEEATTASLRKGSPLAE